MINITLEYSEHVLRMLALGIPPLPKRIWLRTACRAYIGLPRR